MTSKRSWNHIMFHPNREHVLVLPTLLLYVLRCVTIDSNIIPYIFFRWSLILFTELN